MPVSFALSNPFNDILQREQEEFALTKKMKKILDFYLIVSFSDIVVCLFGRTVNGATNGIHHQIDLLICHAKI